MDRMKKRLADSLSVLIFLGSIMAMLYSLFYMQQLSVAFGTVVGIYATGKAYNVTLGATDALLVSGLSGMDLPLKLSDILFAVSLIMFAIAVLQLFQGKRRIFSLVSLGLAPLFVALAYILETSFSFAEPYPYFLFGVSGAALAGLLNVYMLASQRTARGKGLARSINLDPLTPYSNMLKLSDQLIARLDGSIRILDMHFDSKGLQNLAVLLKGKPANCKSVSILTKRERLDSRLVRECRDYADEMHNGGTEFMLRVMDDEDARMQHERLLLDEKHAYKIPPLNIINRKSEHVIRINYKEANRRFSYVWGRGTKLDNLQ